MNKYVLILILGWLLINKVSAQCTDDLYELTLAKAGSDIVLVRDFKVNIKEATKRNPTPVSKFSVFMQDGITYRFIVARDTQINRKPVMQLFDRNELLVSSGPCMGYKDTCLFEYFCKRTGNYQIIFSFADNNGGCAIGFMAMVTNDAFYTSGIKKPVNERFLLYVGVEMPLKLITDNSDIARKDVTTSNGTIVTRDSSYFIVASQTGSAKITVKLYNQADSLVEKTEQEFVVTQLPDPKIKIEGQEKDNIIPSLLGYIVKLEVKPSIYRIVGFYLSDQQSVRGGMRSETDNLTSEMIVWLKSLSPMQRVYFNDVDIETPTGEIIKLNSVAFYIR